MNKTKLGLAALAMSTIISWTQAQANDLLWQCDYNHNWIIDWRTYLKDLKKKLKLDWDYSSEDKKTYKLALSNAKKERHCKTEIIKQENAQQERYLDQLDASIEGLKKELKRVDEEIKKIVEENKRVVEENKRVVEENKRVVEENKRVVEENKRVLEELERKKQRLLEQIRKMQQSFT